MTISFRSNQKNRGPPTVDKKATAVEGREKMTEGKDEKKELNTEDLKRMALIGALILRQKASEAFTKGVEVVERIKRELHPDTRFAKLVKNKYDALKTAGLSDDLAEKTTLEYVRELLRKRAGEEE